ncbi:type VII secretion-associated serine protease mycosin [Actinoplanes sp. NPDC049681]|uniref:type VII secretion-associated serine protease mycosin n=1 Tax=Actinoplanes sp. NPDC049681 TaxID=3363905 RepID=UPI003787EB66
MIARKLVAGALVAVIGSVSLNGSPALADEWRDRQWHLDYLKVEEAHRLAKGSGVTVAVIDSGVADHRDLAGSVLPGKDFVKTGGNGHTDLTGHGTSMAGLIAAHGEGDRGVLGIAPEAKILPIRVLGRGSSQVNYGPALEYAISKGAKVINMSLGGTVNPSTIRAINAAKEADVVLIAAAGNKPEDQGVIAPAILDGVLAVGATDRKGNLATVSVTGPAIDLTAPGADMTTTNNKNDYAFEQSGTSDAAAVVSGAAALLRSKYPDMTAEEVVQRLEDTATDKGPPGVDDEYGHGIVNIVAALKGSNVPASGQPSNPAPTASTPPTAPTQTAQAAPDPDPASNNTPLIVGAAILALLTALTGIIWIRRRSTNRPT